MAQQKKDADISSTARNLVAAHCAVAGLCPLIPIPFVDDMIIKRIHWRMNTKLAQLHDIHLTRRSNRVLTTRESSLLSGALKSMVMWPVKKILKKIVFVFAIKSCADVATALFHEGWLMARALEQGYVDREKLKKNDIEEIKKLRDGIVEARDAVDPDVTKQAMRSAFGVSSHIFGSLLESIKGALQTSGTEESKIAAAREKAQPITARIERELDEHWSTGPALDEALRKALSA